MKINVRTLCSALFLPAVFLFAFPPSVLHPQAAGEDIKEEKVEADKAPAVRTVEGIIKDLAEREWYRQKKDEKAIKKERIEKQDEADLSSIRESASEELNYILVLLGEVPIEAGKKGVYAPVFLTDKKNIWGSDTDFSFKWVGFKAVSTLSHRRFPWKNTTLSETLIGSFLYASGTNLGFYGGKLLEEKRFYTNYASEIVTLKCRLPWQTAAALSLDSRQYFFVEHNAPDNFVMPKNHVNAFPRLDLNLERLTERGLDQLTSGVGIESWIGYGVRSSWSAWGEPSALEEGSRYRTFVIYSLTLSAGLLSGSDNRNLVMRLRYKGGQRNDFLNRPRFGGTIDNAKLDVVHGFTVDEFRVDDFTLMNLKYGFDIVKRLRMNIFFDYARASSPSRMDVFGSGYGFRILAFGGLPVWLTHGIGKKYYPERGPYEHVVMFMTAAGW